MELPMFPLGMVLFPSLFLPLHVFEPRIPRAGASLHGRRP